MDDPPHANENGEAASDTTADAGGLDLESVEGNVKIGVGFCIVQRHPPCQRPNHPQLAVAKARLSVQFEPHPYKILLVFLAHASSLLLHITLSTERHETATAPHSTHGILTPNEAYDSKIEPVRVAA